MITTFSNVLIVWLSAKRFWPGLSNKACQL
jgi:hypothetical protein